MRLVCLRFASMAEAVAFINALPERERSSAKVQPQSITSKDPEFVSLIVASATLEGRTFGPYRSEDSWSIYNVFYYEDSKD